MTTQVRYGTIRYLKRFFSCYFLVLYRTVPKLYVNNTEMLTKRVNANIKVTNGDNVVNMIIYGSGRGAALT